MSVTITFDGADEGLELNLSNSNFYALANALGLSINDEGYGEERAEVVFNLCKSLALKRLIKDPYREGNYLDCGRTLEQVTRYKWNLMKLAIEAIHAGKNIRWY